MQGNTNEHEELLLELGQVFYMVFRKMSTNMSKLAEHGLSASQTFILEILEKHGPKKISDIAEALNITLPSVTGLSDRLLAAGYIVRERSPEDRRIVLLDITEKGKEMLRNVQMVRREIMKQFYACLSTEDIRDLIRIYSKILSSTGSSKE
jgi:DNA-binding MarR family transcriptional regulator